MVNRNWLQAWQSIDWTLLILCIGLTVYAGLVIRSSQLTLEYTEWWQHWLTGAIGVAIALVIARWRYEILVQWTWIIYVITNLSLIAVMVLGTTALGAQRWITIGGFNIQPSEFAKLGLIITLATMLEGRTAANFPTVLKSLAVAAVPWSLVFLQPDLGTSLVFGAITLGMLYWANANPGWLLLLVSPMISAILFSLLLPVWFIWVAGMAVIAWLTIPGRWLGAIAALTVNLVSGRLGEVLWDLLKPYQKDRIVLFLDPSRDPLGGGYHLIQSRIAIGSGELWGRGLGQGTQTQGGFIPEQHTDFIFSAVGEEWGFVGAIVVLFVFWLICLRLVIIAQTAKEDRKSVV